MFTTLVFLSLAIIPHADELSIEKVPIIIVAHQYDDTEAVKFIFTQYIFFEYGGVTEQPYKVRHWVIAKDNRPFNADTTRQIFYYYDPNLLQMKKVHYDVLIEEHSQVDRELRNRNVYTVLGTFSPRKFLGNDIYKLKTKYRKLTTESY